MKLSTLLEIIGSGSILLVVGVALLGLGASYGFSEATHLPLWASLCGVGLFFAIIGVAVIDRGSEEAEQQVKTASMLKRALQNPLLIMGASVVGGIVLQRLFRGRHDAEKTVVALSSPPTEVAEPKPEAESFSITKYAGDQLRSLGTIASGLAISMGLKALGIPSMDQLVGDLLSGETQKESEKENESASTSNASSTHPFNVEQDDELFESPNARLASPTLPSHNGFNYPAPVK